MIELSKNVEFPKFDDEEFLFLSRELEQHHAVFYKLWNLGKPQFTDKIFTASVGFNKVGDCIEFFINYDFWKTLTTFQKQFIICHECLHVILNHGVRLVGAEHETNKALDIVVNHSLIERFGFNRKDFDPDNKYCWVDTVFKDKEIPTDKFFEYYYNLLNEGNYKDNPSLVDDHSNLGGMEDLIKKLNDELNQDDKNSLKEFIEKNFEEENKEAGNSSGNYWIFVDVGKVKQKRKWETVIKKWASKFVNDKSEDQWAVKNRRMLLLDENLIIPTEAEIESPERNKIQVWFFQDTSGSCSGFRERFFTAAKSLPTDRFDVKMHCFDTRVFETTLESGKLYGFGGTSFSCIEDYIQSYMRNNNIKKYPTVFVITDGYGDIVNPQVPQNWYLFIKGSF